MLQPTERLRASGQALTAFLPSDAALDQYSQSTNTTLSTLLVQAHSLNHLFSNAIVANASLNLANMVGQNFTTVANASWQVVAAPQSRVDQPCPFALLGPNDTRITFQNCTQVGTDTCQVRVLLYNHHHNSIHQQPPQQAVYVVNTPLMATPPNTTAPAPTNASAAFAAAFPLPPDSDQACISLLDAAGPSSSNNTLFYQLMLASKYAGFDYQTVNTAFNTGLHTRHRVATWGARS